MIGWCSRERMCLFVKSLNGYRSWLKEFWKPEISRLFFCGKLLITNIWGVLKVGEKNRHCHVFKNTLLALSLAMVFMTSALAWHDNMTDRIL